MWIRFWTWFNSCMWEESVKKMDQSVEQKFVPATVAQLWKEFLSNVYTGTRLTPDYNRGLRHAFYLGIYMMGREQVRIISNISNNEQAEIALWRFIEKTKEEIDAEACIPASPPESLQP